MHHAYSDLGKEFSTTDFPELDIESITDITGADNTTTTKEDYGERWGDFRNILCILLKDKSAKNMIESVSRLEYRSIIDIYSVTVGYNNIEIFFNGVPDDPEYYTFQSSYYNLIGLPQAWDLVSEANHNVKVAVLERGIQNHSDLDDHLITGYDFINDNTQTNEAVGDKPWHGVAVAGVVGEFHS